MGYTTTFTGRFEIEPPLTEAECTELRAFAAERHEGRGAPGYWCQWVPTLDGTALKWDGGEKFYAASAWVRYLVDRFLAPYHHPRDPEIYDDEPPVRHVLNGTVHATGQDGAQWLIKAVDNEVETIQLCGAEPADFAVFIMERGRHYDTDREYDAAFDLGWNQFAEFRAGDPRVLSTVEQILLNSDAFDITYREGDYFADEPRGLSVHAGAGDDLTVTVRLDAEIARRGDPDRVYSEMIALCIAIATALNWVAVAPCQRSVLRPGSRFRARVISQMAGWLEEQQWENGRRIS